MIRFLEIREGLYLVEQPITPEKEVKEPAVVNHLWIYDRSGSMYGRDKIGRLCEDLKTKANGIPLGDTLSIGWFSSEGGDFNWVLKGFRVSGNKDKDAISAAIDKNNTTRSTTCFSEILGDASQVIEDLAVISPVFSLAFFTDGYPVVSNYQREVDSVFKALERIKGKVTSAILVGYGDYYNKSLMATMAERVGGQLIHAKDIDTFSLNLDRLISESRQADGKILVEPVVLSPEALYFSIQGKGVTLYETDDEDRILFTPQKGENFLYMVSETVPDGAQEFTWKGDTPLVSSKSTILDHSMFKAGYAAAAALVNKARTDAAVDLLGKLGDKHIVKLVNNAYTNAEYGAAETVIASAMAYPNQRYQEGYDPHFVPKTDAFCLLDALDLLIADPDAYFYPTHPLFKYKRIGPSSRTQPGYPEFIPEDLAKCSFSTLVWNDKKLNLSVLAKINGKVKLNGEPEKFGFAHHYPTHCYRNYTIVKDGFLNTTSLPASMSRSTYDKLAAEGVIDSKGYDAHSDNRVYFLEFWRIPIINRALAEGYTSAENLATLAWQELIHEASLKVYRFLRNEIAPDDKAALPLITLSEEQADYLLSNGIGKNGYAPPQDKPTPTDRYFAKTFRINIKGFASLPKVEEVREKRLKGGTLKGASALMAQVLDAYYGQPVSTMADEVKLTYLDNQIQAQKESLFRVRSKMQRAKFSVILAKKWFKEFTSRENCELELGGIKYAFELGEVEVPI